jgi:signal transduction histidine kinase
MIKFTDNRSEWSDRLIEIMNALVDSPPDETANRVNLAAAKWTRLSLTDSIKQLPENEQQLIGNFGRLLEDMDQSLTLVEAAHQAKSEMLANISHEIRTPLHSMMGYMELIKESTLAASQKEHLGQALASAKILIGIVNNILDYSKMEAGVMELECTETDLPVIFSNGIQLVQLAAKQKGLSIRQEIDPKTPRYISTDPLRLQQIFTNLLSNAVKFTDTGEVVMTTTYTPESDTTGIIRFSVRDTGIGITEAQKKNLFKPFVQGDSTITRRYGGTGLGLIISNMIAQQMNSKIQLDNGQPTGTTFYFDLPVQTTSPITWEE